MSGQWARVAQPRMPIVRPSKWPWTIVSIALALSFVSGTLIAIDSSQSAIVEAKTSTIPIDFIGTSTSSEALDNPSFISANIDWITHGPQEIRAMEACEVITHAFVMDSYGNYPPYYPGGYYPIFFLPSDSPEFLASYKITGTVPAEGTIALPQQMADDMSLSVGDDVTLLFLASELMYDPAINDTRWFHEQLSVPFTVSQIWTQDGPIDQGVTVPQYLNVDPRAVLVREFLNPAIVNIADLYPIIEDFGPMLRNRFVGEESQTLYFIWIDRGQFIDFADTQESIRSLDAFYAPLSDRCSYFDVDLQRSELVYALSVTQLGGTSGHRFYYLGLSLPILVLGIYVTAVGAGISTDLRESNLQAASAQGIRRRSILGVLTLESVAVGIVAGVVGYLLGILVSDALLSSIVTSIGWYEDVHVTDAPFAFTWFTLLATLGSAVFTVVLASLFASLRATRPPRTAPSELEVLHLLPIKEIALIGLSLFTIIGVLSGTQWVGAHGFDWYFGSPGAFLESYVLLSFPVMPLMLAVGLVGLLTKWPFGLQGRLARVLSKGADKVSVPLGPMAARCERRSRKMSILAALVVALVIFVAVSSNTILSAHKESVRLDFASDVSVPAEIVGGWWQGDAWYPDGSFPTEANFTAIAGVSHCALYQHFMAGVQGNPYGWTSTVDPASYLATVRPTGEDVNGDPDEVLALLDSSTNALVTEGYASEYDLDEGQALTMQLTGYVVGSNDSVVFTLDLVVAHVVNRLPALMEIVIGYSAVSSIPKYTFDHIATDGGVLIDVEDGADQESVASQATQIFTSAGLYCYYSFILDEQMEDIDEDPDQGGLFSFLTAETWISTLVVLVGVAMSSYSTARFVMTASLRSGMAGERLRAVRTMLASESASLAVIGVSVGAFVGVLTSYLFGMMWKPYDFPRSTVGADFTVMILLIALVLTVGIVILAAVSSFVGSSREPIKLAGSPEPPPGPGWRP